MEWKCFERGVWRLSLFFSFCHCLSRKEVYFPELIGLGSNALVLITPGHVLISPCSISVETLGLFLHSYLFREYIITMKVLPRSDTFSTSTCSKPWSELGAFRSSTSNFMKHRPTYVMDS
ncbi:hypothetical protein BDV12DRAFT_2243 [Aspergillus spectabilis]